MLKKSPETRTEGHTDVQGLVFRLVVRLVVRSRPVFRFGQAEVHWDEPTPGRPAVFGLVSSNSPSTNDDDAGDTVDRGKIPSFACTFGRCSREKSVAQP